MARRIPLKTVMVENGADGPHAFSWGELLVLILKFGGPTRGMSLDDVMACVDALKPLDKAMSETAEYVTFTEAQYKTLRSKLDQFQFGLAIPEVVEFGLAIRDAPEIV